MAATRIQVWLNPHSIVAPAEVRARRAASQLKHFNKDREVCWCLRKNDGEKSRKSFHFGVSAARALLYPGLPNPLVKGCSSDPYVDSIGTLARESY
jgi:hypothetical protein